MRIAFVSANREKLPDPVVPLGLLYVMESTPAQHERTLIDLCFEARPLEHLAREIEHFRPDLIAVGMRNIQNNDYSGTQDNLDYYARLFEVLRAQSDAPVVIGGGGFSVMPRALMRHLRPDYGISGEGEQAFCMLIERLEAGGRGLTEVPNLHHFLGDTLVVNPAGKGFQDLDALPAPRRVNVDARYYQDTRIDSVQTKRGCPLRCDYCTYPIIEGRSIRQRDPARVVDELFAARADHPEINHFFIVDSVFNLPPKHAKAVCREMIRRGFDVPWTAYANPLGFDRELADLMAESGCAGLEIGSDSGVDEVLVRLRKGFKTREIRRIHELCSAAGVPDCHTFILGTRGETMEDVHRTLEFTHDLQPYGSILMVWKDDEESVDPALAEEREAFRQEIVALLDREKAKNPTWIVPPLGFNFNAKLFSWLRRRQHLTGPLWQHIHMVKAA